jgi:penicillin-binding protein 1B
MRRLNDPVRGGIVAALTLFLVGATALDFGIAALYARSAARISEAPPIGDRSVRIFGRPLRVSVGQRLSQAALAQHLRRIGYYPIRASEPGCYATDERSLTIWSRYPELPSVTLKWDGDEVVSIALPSGDRLREADIEPDTILTLTDHPAAGAARLEHDPIPFAALDGTPLGDAIIASEDRWFATHHGLDLRRLALAPILGGGASTITMQVARLDILQNRSRTIGRKLNEIGAAMVIERTHTKHDILRAYVNSIDVGAARGRTVRGFGAAAREFFGIDDVRHVDALQAATLAALLNQPSRYLDALRGGDDTRLRLQRNRVLRLMRTTFPERYASLDVARLEREPASLAMAPAPPDALDGESRYFLDYAAAAIPDMSRGRVYLTLDSVLQRVAADAVEHGLASLEARLGRAAQHPLQAALVAIAPETGEVLAMIGGRSYGGSQFNRALSAGRPIGSVMKPFDYLAAFERAADEGRTDASPATIVVDEPTVFRFAGLRPWRPVNFGNEYSGRTTWLRALAESRNVAAVKVAASAGFTRVARLWQAASGQPVEQVFPSIALGAISATPADVATAYSTFANDGVARPLRSIVAVIADGRPLDLPKPVPVRVARSATTAVVADMMRAVLTEGTARGARKAGLTGDAAGKTGTTNDLRDAWFAGFTPHLLAVVWVGYDDNRPLGLTGAQAALPIWTDFMMQAAAHTQ